MVLLVVIIMPCPFFSFASQNSGPDAFQVIFRWFVTSHPNKSQSLTLVGFPCSWHIYIFPQPSINIPSSYYALPPPLHGPSTLLSKVFLKLSSFLATVRT